MSFREAVIAVTYRCNARCTMCNIWREESSDELDPSQYLKLPATLRTINITGGEPFLRKDVVDVVQNIHSVAPKARMVFSTNGSRKETVVSTVKSIRDFHSRVGVGVSIDGLEATHDRIRGVPGIFSSAISTIEALQAIGIKDLRIGMTIMPENVGEVKEVFDLARRLRVEFTATFAHNSDIYFKKNDNFQIEFFEGAARDKISSVIDSQLKSGSVKNWYRAYHMRGILDPDLRKEFANQCEAGHRYFFMAPSGNVYPCMVLDKPMGNIRNIDSWDQLFTKENEKNIGAFVRSCREDCWMVCNTRSLIKAHPFKSTAWVVGNKIRAHLAGGD